ncbi:hypothetical protein [Pseudomonas sp. ATCC 13867]|uniref:hypothetical protein n=1 Tax=Pseudomonas sp. ATCC 13867 TaxID=1294143 RepID=UPI000344AF44|nr:hypothetical protein [Pseudomonas sp. ATCC 13867]
MSLRDCTGILIKLLLLYAYLFLVYALYRYVVVDFGLYFSAGYQNSTPILTITCVWLGASSVLLLGQYNSINSIYKLFSLLFLLLVCAPATLLGFMVKNIIFSSEMLFILSTISLILSLYSHWPTIKIKIPFSLSDWWWLFPGSVLLCFVLYLSVFYKGEISLVGIDEVYAKRALAKEYSAPLLNYLTGWVYGFASPVLLVFGLLRRQYLLALVGLLGFSLIYMAAGHKTALIAPALIIFFYKFGNRLSALKLIGLAVAGLSLILAIDLTSGQGRITPYTFDRMVVAPSVLSLYYMEYFSLNNLMYLSYGVLKYFFENPYGIQPPELIGNYYFDGDWANVNFIGDGYANFGSLGCFLYFFIILIMIKICDGLVASMPINVRLSIFIPTIFYLLNSSPLTILLTGGLLPLLLYLFLWQPQLVRKSA